jgi:hypothetical protein
MCILRNIEFLISSCLLSKLLDRALVNEFFGLCKSWICPEVEYQSWSLWNSTHADQNSELFDTIAERYGIFSDTRPAVQQPWQERDIWIFGHDSLSIISKLNTNIGRHEILHRYLGGGRMLHVCFWSFYPHMNTISARSIYPHLLLGWFLIEAYSYPCRVKCNPVVLSWLLIHLFFNLEAIHQLPMAM